MTRILSTRVGGVCLIACWDTPPPGQISLPVRHPPGKTPSTAGGYCSGRYLLESILVSRSIFNALVRTFVSESSRFASAVMLVIVTADRYVAISQPLNRSHWRYPKTARKVRRIAFRGFTHTGFFLGGGLGVSDQLLNVCNAQFLSVFVFL